LVKRFAQVSGVRYARAPTAPHRRNATVAPVKAMRRACERSPRPIAWPTRTVNPEPMPNGKGDQEVLETCAEAVSGKRCHSIRCDKGSHEERRRTRKEGDQRRHQADL